MKNNLPIDNPLKTRPQAAAKRPALPIHAYKGRFQAAIADDTQSHHLRLLILNKDFRRLMKRSMVMALPAK